jgi:murein endopeptidase
MLEPSGGQRIRIATAIVACPAALTRDMKCRSAGARSLASRNAWPIGTTRSGCAAGSRAVPVESAGARSTCRSSFSASNRR